MGGGGAVYKKWLQLLSILCYIFVQPLELKLKVSYLVSFSLYSGGIKSQNCVRVQIYMGLVVYVFQNSLLNRKLKTAFI